MSFHFISATADPWPTLGQAAEAETRCNAGHCKAS